MAAHDCAAFELELESTLTIPSKYGPVELKVEGRAVLAADASDSRYMMGTASKWGKPPHPL
jgi:hypothetical protein